MAGGSKEHVEKVKESKFNRQRAETEVLRANCTEGYIFTNTVPSSGSITASGQCEFHHVLPISSLQDGVILGGKGEAEEMDFIHKCMAKTTWDINTKPNLLGLPTKGPYEAADREVANNNATAASLFALNPQAAAFGALPNLPCHMNDHDKFTKAVIDKLDQDLWPNLVDNREKCEDKGKSIRSLLRAESNHWKSWLTTRGGEHGGAADCWVNRENKRSVWYIPLSMAPSPTKTDPPPNVFKRGERSIAAWLEKIFSWAG